MKLLFIQGGSRLKLSDKGLWYTDPNFTEEVWNRYLNICDELVVVLRRESKIYSDEEAKERFNLMPQSPKIRLVALDDITRPKSNMVNPLVRKRIKNTIFKEVATVDKCIIRFASIYTEYCYQACLKYHKPYLFEVTGFALESLSHHSLIGKLSAKHFELLAKRLAKGAECAIYVTDEALQKRYPCKKMLGCSDVVLEPTDQTVLEKRLNKIAQRKNSQKIIIGTAAFLDVKWKGQENVLRAIAYLKTRGIENIEYQMIGLGSGKRLLNLSKKLGIEDKIRILGAKPHNEVFDWLDSIDIYVQPSYQEGLCRIIVEAMSRACPVICSDTGGNYELIDRNFIFPCGEYNKLAELIEMMPCHMAAQANINFEKSKKFDKTELDCKRNSFLKQFADK